MLAYLRYSVFTYLRYSVLTYLRYSVLTYLRYSVLTQSKVELDSDEDSEVINDDIEVFWESKDATAALPEKSLFHPEDLIDDHDEHIMEEIAAPDVDATKVFPNIKFSSLLRQSSLLPCTDLSPRIS